MCNTAWVDAGEAYNGRDWFDDIHLALGRCCTRCHCCWQHSVLGQAYTIPGMGLEDQTGVAAHTQAQHTCSHRAAYVVHHVHDAW